jgi:hypothetical protein
MEASRLRKRYRCHQRSNTNKPWSCNSNNSLKAFHKDQILEIEEGQNHRLHSYHRQPESHQAAIRDQELLALPAGPGMEARKEIKKEEIQ